MKLGILTFHDGINFGAFAQVYSLQECLKELGHDVAVLNYKNLGFRSRESRAFLRTFRPSTLVRNLRKIAKFRRAQRTYLKLTPYFSNLTPEVVGTFDAIIVGADEVWNYESTLVGLDLNYFCPATALTRYISYAPSFGSVLEDTQVPEAIIAGIKKYSAISVRDKNSQLMIKRITGREPPVVLDPTFLYPAQVKAVLPNKDNYYLYYSADLEPQYQERILEFAHKNGKMLVAIGYRAAWADLNIVTLDPFEWMGWIHNADFVFTTMFHGTIYSILQKRSFVTMVTPYRKNKLQPMMDNLGVAERMLSASEVLTSKLDDLGRQPIDYEDVFEKIGRHCGRSLEFLRDALQSVRNTVS